MAIGCGALVDRLVQAKMLANAARGQVHDLRHSRFDSGVLNLSSAMWGRVGL